MTIVIESLTSFYRYGHVLPLTVCIIIIHNDVEWLEYDTYIKVENV